MKAYEVLEQYDWVQGIYAVDDTGRMCPSSSEKACAFCLLGAIERAYPPSEWFKMASKVRDELNKLSMKEASWPISIWNDAVERTKEEVVALLRRADV